MAKAQSNQCISPTSSQVIVVVEETLLPHDILDHPYGHVGREERLGRLLRPDLVETELGLGHIFILVLDLGLGRQEILHVLEKDYGSSQLVTYLIKGFHVGVGQLNMTPFGIFVCTERSKCGTHECGE